MRSFDGTVYSQNTITATIDTPPNHHQRSASHQPSTSRPTSAQSTTSQRSTLRSPATIGGPPRVVCRVFVPGVGWGNQMSSGEVLVQFADRTELSIQSNPMVVKYKEANGHLHK